MPNRHLTTPVQHANMARSTQQRRPERSLLPDSLTGSPGLPTLDRPPTPLAAGLRAAQPTKNSVDFHCKNILDGPRSPECRKRSIMRHPGLTPQIPSATKATTESRHRKR